MAVIRWNPYRDVMTLREATNRLLEDSLGAVLCINSNARRFLLRLLYGAFSLILGFLLDDFSLFIGLL